MLSAHGLSRWVTGHVVAEVAMAIALPGWVMVLRRATAAAQHAVRVTS